VKKLRQRENKRKKATTAVLAENLVASETSEVASETSEVTEKMMAAKLVGSEISEVANKFTGAATIKESGLGAMGRTPPPDSDIGEVTSIGNQSIIGEVTSIGNQAISAEDDYNNWLLQLGIDRQSVKVGGTNKLQLGTNQSVEVGGTNKCHHGGDLFVTTTTETSEVGFGSVPRADPKVRSGRGEDDCCRCSGVSFKPLPFNYGCGSSGVSFKPPPFNYYWRNLCD